MSEDAHRQPLQGVKVLDFSTLLPGPMAGLMLAEAGARVIKVERPEVGEEMRHYQPLWGRDAASFALLNRGKLSLALDLKDPAHLDMIEPLVREADVIIEQFRPGVMDRLGLGYDAVSSINPGIIYCSITGYGQHGPKSAVAGHDLNYIGDTGLLSLAPGPADNPTVPPLLAADLAGGSYPAVVNILLALMNRQHTGAGTHLDIAMSDNMFMLMTWAIANSLVADAWPKPGGELLTGGSPRYKLYPARDGALVAVAALEDKFWATFCGLIRLEQRYHDDRADPAATMAAVARIIASRTGEEWRRVFYGHDCCCSVVKSFGEAMRDEHFHMRGLFDFEVENERGDTLPATPVSIARQFRDDDARIKSAPALGAHNDMLLKGR